MLLTMCKFDVTDYVWILCDLICVDLVSLTMCEFNMADYLWI